MDDEIFNYQGRDQAVESVKMNCELAIWFNDLIGLLSMKSIAKIMKLDLSRGQWCDGVAYHLSFIPTIMAIL